MTTRDIRAHLREMYDVDVSPDLISRVTDAVVDELTEWQSRTLDKVWPVIFTGALMVKIRDAAVHGYASAYWAAGAFFAAGALLTTLLYRSGRPHPPTSPAPSPPDVRVRALRLLMQTAPPTSFLVAGIQRPATRGRNTMDHQPTEFLQQEEKLWSPKQAGRMPTPPSSSGSSSGVMTP